MKVYSMNYEKELGSSREVKKKIREELVVEGI